MQSSGQERLLGERLEQSEPFIELGGQQVIPGYLDVGDNVWVQALVDVYRAHAGQTRRELRIYIAQSEDHRAGRKKWEAVCKYLGKTFGSAVVVKKPTPRQLRREVFRLASAGGIPSDVGSWRASVLEQAATLLNLEQAEVGYRMLSDLPDEQLVTVPKVPLDPDTIRLWVNQAMVRKFLSRAAGVWIRVRGHSRPMVRQAKWRGLICTIHPGDLEGVVVMEISGPLAILRKTRVYGQRLGELIPFLMLTDEFTLRARIPSEGGTKVLCVRSGDPIFPKLDIARFDSKLEEKFAAQFARATKDWELIREPCPLTSGRQLVFPDFALRHRSVASLVWYLEIVGFWTPEYLAKKLSAYREVEGERVILCIRDSLQCSSGMLPPQAKVVRFRGRIDPVKVLEIIDMLRELTVRT